MNINENVIEDADVKLNLPEDFHEKLLDLENQLINNRSIEVIEELTNLYKFGAEFYSGVNVQKQGYYAIKLQDMYMDTKILKLIESHHKSVYKSRKHLTTNQLKVIKEDELNFNEDEELTNEPEGGILKRSKSIGIKHEFNFNRNNRKRQATLTSRQSGMFNQIGFKRKNTVLPSKTTVEDLCVAEEIKQTNEVVKNYISKLENSKKIIDDSIKQQTISFKQRFRHRKMIALKSEKKNDRGKRNSLQIPEINSDFITFLNTERKISEDGTMITPKKRHSVINTFLVSAPIKTFNLSLKTESKILKYKKKTLSVNEIFEDFTNKFHYIYFQKYCDVYFKNAAILLNENYIKKKTEFFKIEDQIKELKLMCSDNESYQEQFNLMVDELEIRREDNIKPLITEIKNQMDNLFKSLELSHNPDFLVKLSGIIDDLINNLISMIK